MKVLIGIDDSLHSRAALEFVKNARWPAATAFVVLSAVPLHVAVVEMAGYPQYQDMQREQTREHEELAARVEGELRSAGLMTTAKVEAGDPREVIPQVAEAERVDLVVVGSHGRSGISKLLMGSVASHVVTHSPCSVLVVKLPKVAEKKLPSA